MLALGPDVLPAGRELRRGRERGRLKRIRLSRGEWTWRWISDFRRNERGKSMEKGHAITKYVLRFQLELPQNTSDEPEPNWLEP